MTSAITSRSSLLAEYLRRAAKLSEATQRSSQMERDFLERKVLNRAANEALDALNSEKLEFAAWMLRNHEALVDAPNPPSEGGTPSAEWCIEAFWRVNPGRNATVPSLYLLDFAREVLRVYGAPSATAASGVLPEVAAVGWISVKDRLPEGDDYRVVAKNSAGYATCVTHIYVAEDGKTLNGEDSTPEWTEVCVLGGITHWMPLPSSPPQYGTEK